MKIIKNLKAAGIKEVCFSKYYRAIMSANESSMMNLLESMSREQIQFLFLTDGFYAIRILSRLLPTTNTFHVSGVLSLNNYKGHISLWQVEKEHASAFPLIRTQMKSKLADFNIQSHENTINIDLKAGRVIDGSGSMYFFRSNEYVPGDNLLEIKDLIIEEISIATVSLAALLDLFNIVVRSRKSDIGKIFFLELKSSLGCNDELISKYHNPAGTVDLSPDITSLKIGDTLAGIIDEDDSKKYSIQ